MMRFFAPAVLAAVPWITEGTILEEFVDFEILAAGLSSSRSRRSRLGRTSGSSRWWEPRPRWPPGLPPAAGDHVWLFKKYIRSLIVWWRNRTIVAGWEIRSLDLARLLCHDGHLVGIVAPSESSDHRADHRLHRAHLVSRTIVILTLTVFTWDETSSQVQLKSKLTVSLLSMPDVLPPATARKSLRPR